MTSMFYSYSGGDKPVLVGTFKIREHADAFIRDLAANGKQARLLEAELTTEKKNVAANGTG